MNAELLESIRQEILTTEGVGEVPLVEISADGTLLGTTFERRLLAILMFFNLFCAIGFFAWSQLRKRKRGRKRA